MHHNVKDCQLGRDFIDGLKPREYTRTPRSNVIYMGMLPDEVADVLDGRTYAIHNKHDRKSIVVSEISGPLVKAIQELSEELRSTRERLDAHDKQISQLQKYMSAVMRR